MKQTIIKGILIERSTPLHFEELCQAIGLQKDIVIQMVEYHLIEPAGNSPKEWEFDSIAFKRAKMAANIHRDLEINLQGVALALDLLDKIEQLENRLSRLEKFEE